MAEYTRREREKRQQKYQTDPEYRAKILAKQASPEVRAKKNARARANYATPEGRQTRQGAYRRWLYGLTQEQLEHFNNTTMCESCGDPVSGKTKHVDHNHETGAFRGVLCSSCNLAEGHLKGEPLRAFRLFEYMTVRARKCAQ